MRAERWISEVNRARRKGGKITVFLACDVTANSHMYLQGKIYHGFLSSFLHDAQDRGNGRAVVKSVLKLVVS